MSKHRLNVGRFSSEFRNKYLNNSKSLKLHRTSSEFMSVIVKRRQNKRNHTKRKRKTLLISLGREQMKETNYYKHIK